MGSRTPRNHRDQGMPPQPAWGPANGTHPIIKSDADINRERSPAIKKGEFMRKIQNDNITFRVTTDLKKRLTE